MSPLDQAKSQSSTDSTLGSLIKTIESISKDSQTNILPATNELDKLRNTGQLSGAVTFTDSKLNSTESIVAAAFCKGNILADDPRMLLIKEKFSSVEQDFCKRAGVVIPLYGYDIFDGRFVSGATSGEINDDYIIGIGDTLIYTFVGSLSNSASVIVNSQGSVVLDNSIFSKINLSSKWSIKTHRELSSILKQVVITPHFDPSYCSCLLLRNVLFSLFAYSYSIVTIDKRSDQLNTDLQSSLQHSCEFINLSLNNLMAMISESKPWTPESFKTYFTE